MLAGTVKLTETSCKWIATLALCTLGTYFLTFTWSVYELTHTFNKKEQQTNQQIQNN